MALPVLLRKLFKSSGSGSELNDGIVSKTISNQDWSNAYNYPVGAIARGSNGTLYYSVAQSGPGTSAGAKNPVSAGASYWVSLDIASLESSINSALAGKVSTSTYNSGMATKVALDGSNASSIGKTLSTYMTHAAMPDLSQTITVSLPYTVPADGYILASIYANQYTNTTRILFGSVVVFGVFYDGVPSNVGVSTIIPVSKGIQVTSEGTGITSIVFAYANGSKP